MVSYGLLHNGDEGALTMQNPALAWETMQNPASSTIFCRKLLSGEVCCQEMVLAVLAGGNSSSVTFK